MDEAIERTRQVRRLRLALLSLAVAVAGVAWAVSRDGGREDSDARVVHPRIVNVEELRNFADSVELPVYWAGPITGARLELSEQANGDISVRYLTAHAHAGTSRGDFLTIGTYPQADAAVALDNAVAASATIAPDGTRVVSYRDAPGSAYFAGVDNRVEVEVYDPAPGKATRLAGSGRVVPIPAG